MGGYLCRWQNGWREAREPSKKQACLTSENPLLHGWANWCISVNHLMSKSLCVLKPWDEYTEGLKEHQEAFIWGRQSYLPGVLPCAACERVLACSCVPGRHSSVDLGRPGWLTSHLGLRFGLLSYPHATTCLLQDGWRCRADDVVWA